MAMIVPLQLAAVLAGAAALIAGALDAARIRPGVGKRISLAKADEQKKNGDDGWTSECVHATGD